MKVVALSGHGKQAIVETDPNKILVLTPELDTSFRTSIYAAGPVVIAGKVWVSDLLSQSWTYGNCRNSRLLGLKNPPPKKSL